MPSGRLGLAHDRAVCRPPDRTERCGSRNAHGVPCVLGSPFTIFVNDAVELKLRCDRQVVNGLEHLVVGNEFLDVKLPPRVHVRVALPGGQIFVTPNDRSATLDPLLSGTFMDFDVVDR